LFAGSDHADGDRQVEARPFLFHIGWREVDGSAAESEAEAGVDQGGHHTIAGFLNRHIRKPNDNDQRISVTGVDFHLDRIRFDAADRGGTNLGQHDSVMNQRGGKRNDFLQHFRIVLAGETPLGWLCQMGTLFNAMFFASHLQLTTRIDLCLTNYPVS
jgi:hypothetical protein